MSGAWAGASGRVPARARACGPRRERAWPATRPASVPRPPRAQPFKPINTSLYLCDNKFHTEALNELLEADNK